ncbi:MAG: hypothetical protein U0228_23500 [Myxococcaceae bacterium]
MSVTTNPQGTYSIEYDYRDDDSPVELYRVEYWNVTSVLTGREVFRCSSTEVQRAGKHEHGEIKNVTFDAAGTSLVVSKREGPAELVPLPTAFRLTDDDRELVATYADGRETRELLKWVTLEEGERIQRAVADDFGDEPKHTNFMVQLLRDDAKRELSDLRARLKKTA